MNTLGKNQPHWSFYFQVIDMVSAVGVQVTMQKMGLSHQEINNICLKMWGEEECEELELQTPTRPWKDLTPEEKRAKLKLLRPSPQTIEA